MPDLVLRKDNKNMIDGSSDTTIAGGRFWNSAGVLTNAFGDPIDQDGNVLNRVKTVGELRIEELERLLAEATAIKPGEPEAKIEDVADELPADPPADPPKVPPIATPATPSEKVKP